MINPIERLAAKVGHVLSINMVIRFTLRIRNNFIGHTPLLIRQLTAKFGRVRGFISVLKLVKLVSRRLLRVVGNRTDILRTTSHARAIRVTVLVRTLTNFNTIRINRRSLLFMMTRHKELRIRLNDRLAGNVNR